MIFLQQRFGLPAAIVLLVAPTLSAQNTSKEVSENGVSFGAEQIAHWRVGLVVKATKGPMQHVMATIPVPIAWPEQEVKLVKEEVTRGVQISKKDLGGVRQLMIRMPAIPHGRTAQAVFTYQVSRKEVLGPKDTSQFVVPKSAPRAVKRWLNPSPYIESRDSKTKSLSRDAIREVEGAWEQVEAIYDLVREKVEYKEGKIKTSSQALRDGHGDCEELTSLFIAMCRASKIPARMVWVPDHCYPEFFLMDKEGQGHWFPCQAAGTRSFGGMPEMRPILQKGDNFKVHGKTKPQRYVSEWVAAKPVRGSGKPKVNFIFEYVQPNG